MLLGSVVPGPMVLGTNAADPIFLGPMFLVLSSQGLILLGSRLMLLMQFSSQPFRLHPLYAEHLLPVVLFVSQDTSLARVDSVQLLFSSWPALFYFW